LLYDDIMNLYIHNLGRKESKLAATLRVDCTFYESDGGYSSVTEGSKKRTISDNADDFFDWHEEVIGRVDEFLREKYHNIDVTNSAFNCFLKSILMRRLSDDIRLMVLSKGDTAAIIQVEHYEVIRVMYPDNNIVRKERVSSYQKLLKNIYKQLKLFAAWPINMFNKKILSDHLILPRYEFYKSNAEFFSLYNAIGSSVVVLTNAGSGIEDYLLSENKKIVNKNKLYISPIQFILLSIEFFRLVVNLLPSIKSILTLEVVSLYILEHSTILSYFNVVDVKYIGVVRGDNYTVSTLLRRISSEFGVTTYSLSHAVYYYKEYYLSLIDYDYYGISGWDEKNVYAGLWNKDVEYQAVGQPTYSYREDLKTDLGIDDSIECSNIICIYPTTVDEKVLPHTRENFMDFIDSVCGAYESDQIAIYKSKNNYKILRNEKLDADAIDIEREAIIKFEKNIDRFSVMDKNISVYDTYGYVDIGYVYMESTVAFELIQNRKKVLVYWPIENKKHPFSLYAPLLVAGTIEEFVAQSKILREMEYDDYEKYIIPTLEYCLVVDSDQALMNFICKIES